MTTIVTKNGSGAPLASDLVQGELAVDLTNKRLYTEDSGGTVIEVGTSPSTIDINAGTIDGTVIGGSSAAAGTFTTFTSTGIDDNATSTAITIDASENVGIGTASPTNLFHVSATGLSTPALIQSTSTVSRIAFRDTNTTDSNSVRVGSSGDGFAILTGGSERMRITSAGNVGIGTTSPQELLHLRKDASAVVAVKAQNNTTNGIMEYQAGNDADNWFFGIDASDNFGISDVTGQASQKLVITQAGNVGIGTASPDSILHIRSSVPTLTFDDSNFATRKAKITANDGNLVLEADHLNSANSSIIGFKVDGSEAMRIDSSGNLLVGTTTQSGTATFTVNASNANKAGIYVNGYSNNEMAVFDSQFDQGSSGGVVFKRSGAFKGNITWTSVAVSYNTTSDERLKENIVDAPAGNIDDIRVRSFDWKADGSHQTYGVVAQELVDVAPEAVSQGETEEDMWGVDYSKLVPMMIKEIQDLKAEVAALKGA